MHTTIKPYQFNLTALASLLLLTVSMPQTLTSEASTLKITNDPEIELNLNARDDLSGVAFKRFRLTPHDWKEWSPYDAANTKTKTNILTDGGKEGLNHYIAIVKDFAENESDTLTRDVLLDLTGAVTTGVQVQPLWTNKNSIKVIATATDNFEPDTQVQSINLSNDRSNFIEFTATDGKIETNWTIPLIDGTQTLYVNATDNAGTGNTGAIISTTYMVDTVKPDGGIKIEQGGDFVPSATSTVTFNVRDFKTAEDNKSGVKTVKIFDTFGSNSYTLDFDKDLSLKEETDITIPWQLATNVDSGGLEISQVGMEITDRAGNKKTVYSQLVTVSQLVATQLCVTDLINPRDYPTTAPFTPVCYNNLTGDAFTPLPMLMGGSFTLAVHYTYPALANASWSVNFAGSIEYQENTNRGITHNLLEERLTVNGLVTHQEITPYPTNNPTTSIKNGMSVYFSSTLEIYDILGRKVGYDFLPRPQGASLKIGYIDGDIREYLKFNETN